MTVYGKKPSQTVKVKSRLDRPDYKRIKDRLEHRVYSKAIGRTYKPIAISENKTGVLLTFI